MSLIMRNVRVHCPRGGGTSMKWSARIQGGQKEERSTVKREHFPEKLVCVQIVALHFWAVLFSFSPVSGFGVNTGRSLQ